MNSSAPQDSMKALMEAVTQVTTSRPAVRYPFHSQPAAANFFLNPGSGGGIAMNPFLAQSAQNINNMVSNMVGNGIMMNPAHLAQTSATDAVSALAAAQAQANGIGSIPLRKRNHDCAIAGIATTGEVGTADIASPSKRSKQDNNSILNHRQEERDRRAVTKTKRLEQNRLAAIESRRRKKHMVEELQRSVQFYTKANGTLKGQNSELERQLLVAKQKMLERQQQQQQHQHQQQGVVQVASVGASLACPPERRRAVSLESSKPQARASVQPSVGIGNPSTSRTYPPALFGNAASMDMEQQAQQAQFSATQALYKSMGYPAGAARVAASTFSQFVGQTGLVPGAPPAAVAAAETVAATRPPPPLARTRETCNTAAVSVVTPQVNAMPHIPSTIPQVVPQINSTTATAITSPVAVVVPKKESDEGDYIQALNRFAMQQAAAANAAAAAANAAIQAVHLHKQMKGNTTTNGNGGNNASTTTTTAPSSAAAQVVPSLPISFPGLTWPFQGQASSQ